MKKLMIIGAGSAGLHVIREIEKSKKEIKIVGILDDDIKKIGKTLLSYNILDTHKNLEKILREISITELIIATTCISHREIERIYKSAKKYNVKVKTLPSLEELLLEESYFRQIRDVNVDDLLGREPIRIDTENITKNIKGKTVLITGAGGSIGSELVRQIVKHTPKRIINIDMNENELYLLELYLKRHYKDSEIISEVCNIREENKMRWLFKKYRPEIVYHAAAHKHVPLMERNPEEAIKNNVFATNTIIELSEEFLVDRFVLISTDKSVNPTNLMGATKRLAEVLIQKKSESSKTKFMAVRFGNVLGSNGSVIPIFQELLKEKKNLTVTHPEITRYFMTIPEAAQLVIEAGNIGVGGEVFVLDMGEPVKIIDLAKKMIELSGLKINEDVEIEITGLRPGEKLYEELLYDVNNCIKTKNNKIFIGKIKKEKLNLKDVFNELEIVIKSYDTEKIKNVMKKYVSTYIERGK